MKLTNLQSKYETTHILFVSVNIRQTTSACR